MRIHREWGSVRIELGRLWLVWCAPERPCISGYPGEHPNIPGHPNRWMIIWRTKSPEWDLASGRWKTLPAKLDEADRREFGIERADGDEPDKVQLLQAFALTACFRMRPTLMLLRRAGSSSRSSGQ